MMPDALSGALDAALTKTNKKLTDEERQADKNLIKSCRTRYAKTSEHWSEIRKDALSDQRFFLGEQYDTQTARLARSKNNRPVLSISVLHNFVQQIENNMRQQDISIAVHPTDEMGSEEKAKVLQGMVRHIEAISNAKEAYIWAAGSHGALVPGFGFIKVATHYCSTSPETGSGFDQDIFIEGCKDPFKILPDFEALAPDFSDAKFWFEEEQYSKEDYKTKYSNSILNSNQFSNWGDVGKTIGASWLTGQTITVVKYWYRDTTIRHWAEFEDGTQGYLDDFGLELNDDGEYVVCDNTKVEETVPRVPEEPGERQLRTKIADAKANPSSPDEYPITESMIEPTRFARVLRHREVVTHQVRWAVVNGIEILDRGEWNDTEFPFVGVCGNDVVLEGKRKIFGMIRHSKDSQKMLNGIASDVMRKIDVSNKSAWIAEYDSIPESERRFWAASNIENPAVLYWRRYDEQGRELPMPTRGDTAEPAIQNLLQAVTLFQQGIKQSVGIFEAGVGETVGERQSGTAIQTLAQQGDRSNFHFSDNLVLAIKRLGSLILRLIPKIYDSARAVRIINPDDSAEVILINQYFPRDGAEYMFDMRTDENYDVVINTGPSYATRKAEESEQMLKFAGLNPQFMPLIGDLIAHDMDWDVANKIEERLVKWQGATMPFLHVTDDTSNFPPAAKAAIAQLQGALNQSNQHVQTLAQNVQQLQGTLNGKVVEHASKERIAALDSWTQLTAKKLDLLTEMSQSQDKLKLERAKAELGHIHNRMGHVIDTLQLHQAATGMNNDQMIKMMQAQMVSAKPPAAPALPAGTTPDTPTATPINSPVS